MRAFVLVVVMLTSSSCLFGLGGLVTTLAVTGSRKAYREGAAREASERVEHAREAAVARQQHRELERQFAVAAANDASRPRSEPTPPPLIGAEPSRTPLRPR